MATFARSSVFGADENSTIVGKKATGAGSRRALGDISKSANIGEKRAMKPSKAKGLKVRGAPVQPGNKYQRPNPPIEDLMAMSEDEETGVVAGPLPAGVDNIDLDDAQNPQLVADYVYEIDGYMKKLERKQAVPDRYLKNKQTDITDNMRTILLDWLVEVHIRFKLAQETLFMTVHVLDRFLTAQPITRSKLQLAGITSMLIASKYEDMYPPEVRDFIWIADNAYSRAEIISMEGLILKQLDYNLGTPLPLHFFRRLSKATYAEAETHNLGKYLMELSVCNYNMCGFLSSEIATAATFMAHRIMNPSTEAWSKNLEYYSGYNQAHMNDCIQKMSAVLVSSVGAKQQAIRRKFASSKLLKVSELREVTTFINGGGL